MTVQTGICKASPSLPADAFKTDLDLEKQVHQPSSPMKGKDGMSTKVIVLIVLVFQNAMAAILMRLSRSQAEQWNSQAGVVVQELLKLVTCTLLCLAEGSLGTVFENRTEALKTAVPAILYLFQNNMQYVAVTYLDASSYAVMYQTKIISTAMLSVCLLGKQLSRIQWFALVMLTAGVSLVVLSQMESSTRSSSVGSSPLVGFAAVCAAALVSGLAGVYFEKLLKGSTLSLWARNLQLAGYSVIVGLISFYTSEHQRTDDPPTRFFAGFTVQTWMSLMNNAYGGLLIAAVIKYADNILKNFSTSLSIVLTAILSMLLFDSSLSWTFILGTALVIHAVFLYGNMDPLSLMLQRLKVETTTG